MLSPTQILLIVVVSILSTVLAVIGIQVFLILKEGRRALEKLNKILDDATTISSSITKPISLLSSSLSNFTGFGGILSWLFHHRKNKEGKKDE